MADKHILERDLVDYLNNSNKIPEVITFKGEISGDANIHEMISCIKRWREISYLYNRKIIVYVKVSNIFIEKSLQNLVSGDDKILLRVEE